MPLLQTRLKAEQVRYLFNKDYVVFEYTPEDENSIRLYDQIITQGKDLHDGKVYT